MHLEALLPMRAEQNKINKRDQRDPREQQDWGRLLMNEERTQARKLSKVGGGGAGVAVAPGGAVFGCAGASVCGGGGAGGGASGGGT